MESTLVEIIKLYESFVEGIESDPTKNNMLNFVAFLNNQIEKKPSKIKKDDSYNGWRAFDRQILMEMVTAYLGKMGRYADNYSRKAMPSTQLNSIDEFTYLIPLLEFESLSKSELINKNGHAISTGTEIIKRLLKKNYLVQFPDEKDKRSMKVKLSEIGKGALFSSMNVTKNIAKLATGILSNQELIQTLAVLKKLDAFHDDIHRNSKHQSIEELLMSEEIQEG